MANSFLEEFQKRKQKQAGGSDLPINSQPAVKTAAPPAPAPQTGASTNAFMAEFQKKKGSGGAPAPAAPAGKITTKKINLPWYNETAALNQDENKNPVKTKHTTYGGVPTKPGQQRDDVIPAALGGANQSKDNIKYVPEKIAKEQDKIEKDLIMQVKTGKLSPKEAISKALEQKYEAANKPSFWQKLKSAAGDVVHGVATVVKETVAAPWNMGKDVVDTAKKITTPSQSKGQVFPIGEGLNPKDAKNAKLQIQLEANAIPVENRTMSQKAGDLYQWLPRGVATLVASLVPADKQKELQPTNSPADKFLFGDRPIKPMAQQAAEYEQNFQQAGFGKSSGTLAVGATILDEFMSLYPLIAEGGSVANKAFQTLAEGATKDTGVEITFKDMQKIHQTYGTEGLSDAEAAKKIGIAPEKYTAWKQYTNKAEAARAAAQAKSVTLTAGKEETPLSQALKKASTKDIFGGADVPFNPSKNKDVNLGVNYDGNKPRPAEPKLLTDGKTENSFMQEFQKRKGGATPAAESSIPKPTPLTTPAAEEAMQQQAKEKALASQAGFVAPGAVVDTIEQMSSKISNFLAVTQQNVGMAKNIEDSLNTIRTNSQADFLQMKQLLQDVKLTPDDAEAIYHYEEDKSIKLTPDQQAIYDKVIKPLAIASDKLVAKLKPTMPLDKTDYTPRFVQGKGSIIERLQETGRASLGNILSKSVPALKRRVMHAVVDQTGKRTVVSVKGGRVTGFIDKKPQDFGALKFKTNQQLLEQDVKPLQKRVNGLQKTLDGLKSVKIKEAPVVSSVQALENQLQAKANSLQTQLAAIFEKAYGLSDTYGSGMTKQLKQRAAVLEGQLRLLKSTPKQSNLANLHSSSNLEARVAKIQKEMVKLVNEIGQIESKYDPNSLNRKQFVSKREAGGKVYTLTDATTKEIEANTSLRYSKNVLVNRAVTYMKLAKANRAMQFLESMKNSPDFKEIGMKFGDGNVPEGWKTTQLPAFNGYVLEPHVADALDKFAGDWNRGDLSVFDKINAVLRTSIFFNPLIHVPNIVNHWLVNRGALAWAKPIGYKTLFNTSTRAARAIMTLNEDYVEMLRSGASLQYASTDSENLNTVLVKKLNNEIEGNTTINKIKKTLGIALNPYRLSNKVTWFVNDLATMQAIYEDMDHGLSLQQAIQEVGKHIPNYRVPARVMNSKKLSRILTNSNFTMFGAYHYGALRSYGEMAKEILTGSTEANAADLFGGDKYDFGKEGMKNRAKIADKLLALGLITYVLYPALDKVVRRFTKSANAKVRRAGASTFIYNTAQLLQGKMSFPAYLQAIITPSLGTEELLQLFFNRDFFTGQNIYQEPFVQKSTPGVIGKQILGMIPPIQTGQKAAAGTSSAKDAALNFLWSSLGVSNPKSTQPQRNVQDLLYNQKSKISSQIKKDITAGDPQAAQDAINQFNDQLKAAFQSVMEESGSVDQKQLDALMKKNEIKMPKAATIRKYKQNKGKSFLEKLAPKPKSRF